MASSGVSGTARCPRPRRASAASPRRAGAAMGIGPTDTSSESSPSTGSSRARATLRATAGPRGTGSHSAATWPGHLQRPEHAARVRRSDPRSTENSRRTLGTHARRRRAPRGALFHAWYCDCDRRRAGAGDERLAQLGEGDEIGVEPRRSRPAARARAGGLSARDRRARGEAGVELARLLLDRPTSSASAAERSISRRAVPRIGGGAARPAERLAALRDLERGGGCA